MDRAPMKWAIPALAPTICTHSLTAMTNITTVIMDVRRLVSVLFSSCVFLAPTRRVNIGMMISDTITVAIIQMIRVTRAVTHTELSGASSVLGNTPKNLL